MNQANQKAYGLHISLRRARIKFNAKADEAALAELSQLHRKTVWELVHFKDLNRAQRRRIIRSSLFLKEKFTSAGIFDKLKARPVAGGHMQDRSIYSFEETTSPTVNLSSVYMIAGIAAMERRHVASMDIGGAYLNAKIEKDVFMRIDPDLIGLLERIDPAYGEYKEHDGVQLLSNSKRHFMVWLNLRNCGILYLLDIWKNWDSSVTVEINVCSTKSSTTFSVLCVSMWMIFYVHLLTGVLSN